MNTKIISLLVVAVAASFLSCNPTVDPPKPCGPLPTESQLAWHEMQYYAFLHFSMNTFTDKEWGYGDTPASAFNPTDLDVNQWVQVCKDAGMKGIIITAKHHCGFCLWPSKYTEYSIKNSPWKNGKGDILAELSQACKREGLKFGVYLSPWDRNNADYSTPKYITYFRNQMTELLTNYGNIFEVWLDGANGGDGYYGGANEKRSVDRKTYYDWPTTHKLIHKLQPNAIIFSDAGPGCRWCGNERGEGSNENWSLLKVDDFYPGCPSSALLPKGQIDGTKWVPSEVNTSTRPGWFYHKNEDHQVKSLAKLMDIYYQSIGRNANFLLNFPIDRRGRIHEIDAKNVTALRNEIDKAFAQDLAKSKEAIASSVRGHSRTYKAANVLDADNATYWSTDDKVKTGSITITLGKDPIPFNRFLVREYIALGQRVKSFKVEALIKEQNKSVWKGISKQTTIGNKRILRFPTVKASKIRFTVLDSKACPLISTIEVYNAPTLVVTPMINRSIENEAKITTYDKEAQLYYTIDGSEPTTKSTLYEKPFIIEDKALIKAVAYAPTTNKYSEISEEKFDISHKLWKVIGTDQEQANKLIDNDVYTSYLAPKLKKHQNVVIDLGRSYTLKGFKYLPDQSRNISGIVRTYSFYVSNNNRSWKKVSNGEFSNIENSPIWQTNYFKATKGRYIKFEALNTVINKDKIKIAEIDVITE